MRLQRVGRGLADDVGDQPFLPRGVLPRQHHRLAHRRVLAQPRLDLARLDAEAADLHLEVGASQERRTNVARPFLPSRPVAAAVQPRAGDGGERIGDEALGGERGTAQVAARHAHAADQQLAGDADRLRLAERVADVQAHVPQRPADRVPGDRAVRRHRVRGGQDRRLRGAVDDVRPRGREDGAHLRQQVGGNLLAAHEDAADAGQARRPALDLHDVAHQRGDGAQERGVRDLAPAARGASITRAGADQADLRAGDEREKELEEGDVEGARRQRRQHVAGAHAERRAGVGQQADERAVLHRHALRPPRGPGGVDDVRQVLRRGPDRGRVGRPARDRPTPRRSSRSTTGAPGAGEARGERPLRQQHRRARCRPACSASRSAG